MAESVLMIIAVVALGVLSVLTIKRISDFYVERYHFSIWAGTFLFILAFIALALSSNAMYTTTVKLLRIIGFSAIAFVAIRDVQLAKFLHGVLAFIIQFFLAISSFAIFLVIVARFIMNRVLGKRSFLSRLSPGIALGLHGGDPMKVFFTLNVK